MVIPSPQVVCEKTVYRLTSCLFRAGNYSDLYNSDWTTQASWEVPSRKARRPLVRQNKLMVHFMHDGALWFGVEFSNRILSISAFGIQTTVEQLLRTDHRNSALSTDLTKLRELESRAIADMRLMAK